jgi:alkylated DNA repair protein (DNA oxidative demethylase)
MRRQVNGGDAREIVNMRAGNPGSGGLPEPVAEPALAAGLHVLPGFALSVAATLMTELAAIQAAAPPRRMLTPMGRMSVAITSCGALGWTSDRGGYRYAADDPDTGRPWPAMPQVFARLAREAAAAAGFSGFQPDSCLVNRYLPGTRMGLHQDRDECDFTQPIVSVSLGLPATFLWGGLRRRDPVRRVALSHGDVVAWGSEWRLAYHGVATLAAGSHAALGAARVNLTFRRAG